MVKIRKWFSLRSLPLSLVEKPVIGIYSKELTFYVKLGNIASEMYEISFETYATQAMKTSHVQVA